MIAAAHFPFPLPTARPVGPQTISPTLPTRPVDVVTLSQAKPDVPVNANHLYDRGQAGLTTVNNSTWEPTDVLGMRRLEADMNRLRANCGQQRGGPDNVVRNSLLDLFSNTGGHLDATCQAANQEYAQLRGALRKGDSWEPRPLPRELCSP